MSSSKILIFNAEINKSTHDTFVSWLGGELANGTEKVTMLFSSTGGNVASGIAMMNFIRSLPIEIHAHNTGSVASIAIPIFCAASIRSAAPLSTFTFHGSGQTTQNRLEEKALIEMLETTQSNNDMIARAISEKSNISTKDAHQLLRGEIIKSSEWALKNGLCEEVIDYQIPADGPPVTTLF